MIIVPYLTYWYPGMMLVKSTREVPFMSCTLKTPTCEYTEYTCEYIHHCENTLLIANEAQRKSFQLCTI